MRYVGLSINKGKGGGGKVQVDPFTRSSGITTDSDNHVTEAILGDKEYKHIFYDNVGLITGFTEKVGGSSKGWALTYNNQTEQIITDITEVTPTADPSYSFAGNISNMNEGATQTINVTTGGLNNGTTLYWDIVTSYTNSSDWASLTGSFTITNGAGSFDITSIADYTAEGNEIFDINLRTGSNSGPVVALSSIGILNDTSNTNVVGQQVFTSNGTFTVPSGVSEVHVVCIGGGGGASGNGGPGGSGGGGGGLGYKNSIPVTAGQSYTVYVGGGGSGCSGMCSAGAGGDSYFINTSTVKGGGGSGGVGYNNPTAGGSYTGDGGGNGGSGGGRPGGGGGGGGGGAGGYSGNGGNGAYHSSYPGYSTKAGDAGNGGGGGGGSSNWGGDGNQGGGTWYLGQGSSGNGGGQNNGSAGDGYQGSNPSGGSANVSQSYGGGGRGGVWGGGTSGGGGVVRIIWGQGRSFPSTNTQDM